ncbi:hypothetical protein [Mesorhizobium delmotii]|uniref:hypothetical protein n=1 Tax=Mesorhizobium delmotii TaxID=1631247 RepID=UPI000F43CEAC|nr:hypothetical protein [Mesorhizobium delmotii]
MEAPNGETGKNRLDAVDELRLPTGQGLSFAIRLPLVPLFERRDRRHTTILTAQPAEKGAHQKLGVETIGLGAPVLT